MPNTEHSADDQGDAVHRIGDEYLRQLREKILFGLSIYKYVTPTMLHTFLGTSTPASLWKEVILAELLADGTVVSDTVTLTSPHDRQQTYTILHLPENVFVPPEDSSTPPTPTPCAPTDDESEAAAVA